MKWTEYIRDHDKNLMKSSYSRLSALKTISKVSDFKTRKMIGNGIFLSKLTFMVSVWGNCSKELMEGLQIIQNKAARTITKNNWNVHTEENLRQIGWLSINQLLTYFDVVLLHQIKTTGYPRNLFDMYDYSYEYNTRQAASKALKPIGTPKLELTKMSYRWRASKAFNQIPVNITNIEDIKIFKKEVKSWIRENIPLRK